MKKFLKNLLTISTLLILVFQSYLLMIPAKVSAAEDLYSEADNVELGETDESVVPPPPQPDPIQQAAQNLMKVAFDSSNTLSTDLGSQFSLSKISNLSSTSKLLLNAADQQDIRILYCLGNVVPDFANHDDSLAMASGKTIAEIQNLKTGTDQAVYQNLITTAQNVARQNIVANLKNDLPDFACLAGVDENQASDMLKYDQTSVDAVINNAQNKVVIDRRVLELLVNLVTPKDQGGAGHELIKVLCVRSCNNRDATQNSKESKAIYQQMAQSSSSNTPQLNTISDVSAANNTTLQKDPTIASAAAQAEVLDSAGTNQGNLIFSDAESASNISAHYKGEAVDISAVDNIKCTLIKKKRVGSDNLSKLPATPVELTWQTSSGYDNSPPPDYSSLNNNLKQLASGNYAELLNQLGVSVDSTQDLSHSSFSDIVGLIGKSLLGELLSSPDTALTGTSFTDTIKKIGGMVLADDLNLPRQAFVNANLADVNDLETKIGEAQLEKKLGLPWGSLQGNNLNDIFVNIGERHVESSLNIPGNTLSASITDQNSLKLAIGRRTIEKNLSLTANSFGSGSTFKNLEQTAGQRKIDLIYQNPASVDEMLGLGLSNYSTQYKAGSSTMTPDAYATLVANKVLADNVYSYTSSTAAANAARLSVDSTSNSNPAAGVSPVANSNSTMTNILNGQNLSANFQQIGMEILSQSLSTDSDVRAALVQWFTSRLSSSSCAIPASVTVTIPIAGSTTQTKNVTIPEDQFMTNFGLQRGDFFRLFGCINVNPGPVLKNLGEKALYSSIANSTAAKQAEASFLQQHPELTSVLQTIDFYTSRIKTLQTTTAKIQNDWASDTNTDPNVAIFKNQIRIVGSSLSGLDAASIKSGVQAVSKIRELAVGYDQSSGALKNTSTTDQNLRNKINGTLLDFSVIAQTVQEILTGEPQSSISSIQLSQLGSIGSSNTNSPASSSGTQISAASLALMLSGKLTPENFLISVGSNKIENSLGLPQNSLYYYATYVRDKSDDAKISGKDAFFQSIGQAQLEETLHMPANFFQSSTPGAPATLSDVRAHVATIWGISNNEAGARIMQALNLPGDFSTIVSSQTFSTGSTVGLAANSLDAKLSVQAGTTLKLLNGGSIVTDTVSASDSELISGRLNLPQNLLSTFSRVKTGSESLTDGLKQSYASLITFNSHNGSTQQISPTAATAATCPINFSYTKTNGISFSVSKQIQDNSYVYVDATGTKSFPSVNQAQNYAEHNQSSQINFVKGLAQGLASKPTGDIANPFTINAADQNKYQDEVDAFLADQNKAKALSDDEINAISRDSNIPTQTLSDLLSRKDLLENLSQKPINPYLQSIGKRTAESRITTAVFGNLGITVAGMKIDATDIFDLLSGNGVSAIEKIGSRYMEQQLGTGANQVLNVVQSASSILRNCSLATLGANFVGGVLGLGTVSLSGNIYDNIGGAKIEKVLGLPTGSFRGTTLQELMDNIGPVAFARAFQLPPWQILSPDVTINLSLGSSTNNQSIAGQYQIAQSHADFPASDSVISIGQTTSKLDQNISAALGSANFSTPASASSATTSVQSVHDFQNLNFINQTKAIDSMLSINSGTTQQLLTSKITPDDYKKKVADGVIGLTPTGIEEWAKLLGVDSNTLGKINGFASIFSAIKDCKTGNNSNSQEQLATFGFGGGNSCGADLANVFTGFSKIFGVDLDSKVGLPAGTLARVIANPEQAAATMMLSALNKLDNSLGLDPLSGASFTNAYVGLGGPLPDAGAPKTYQDSWRTGNTNYSSGSWGSDTTHMAFYSPNLGTTIPAGGDWEYYGGKIAEQLVGDYLNHLGIIAVPAPGADSPYSGAPNTQGLILQSTDMLLHGDLRVLEVAAAVKSLEALHIYGTATSPNLPAQYRVSYEDIYYAIMGNPTMENQYVTSATNKFYTDYANVLQAQQNHTTVPAPATVTDTTELQHPIRDVVYGAQCPSGVTDNPDCNHSSDPTSGDVNVQQTLIPNSYNGYTRDATDYQDLYGTNIAAPDTATFVATDVTASENLIQAQNAARNKAIQDARNNLMYRMADAKLYQVDRNIPTGFAKTMYSGTGAERTTMLLSYAENMVFHKLGFNQTEVDMANVLINYFKDPKSFNLDSLQSSGKLATFDSWFEGRFSSILGFQLQPGTFTALLYGFKTGSFTKDVTIAGGKTISSLETIYKDWAINKITGWADNALGLPAGTVYQAYTMYRNYEAAKTALSAAQSLVQDAMTNDLSDATHLADMQKNAASAQANLSAVKASAIAFVVNLVFAKQIAQFETALGLVPGTGSMLVTMLITGFNPISVAIFVLMNLFGVYKTEISCTADGYYPKLESPPDTTVSDNGNLGTFDGLDNNAKKAGYITAAQYKAQTLAGDALKLSEKTGDTLAIPSQIMTGRQADVDYWQYKVEEVICSKVGGCNGTRAGLWANPQTTAYTHIGF